MRSLNLPAAVQYVHWAQPNDLDGLFQCVKAKCESLGLTIGRRDNQMPEHLGDPPTTNVRAIVEFVEEVENDAQDDTDNQKAAKAEARSKLVKLYATLSARCAAAGYKPTSAPPPAEPAPLPPASPAPKALA